MKKLTPLEYFIREIKPVPNMHYNSILEILTGYIRTHMYHMPYWELKKLRDVIDEGLDLHVMSEEKYLHDMQPWVRYAIEHLKNPKFSTAELQAENLQNILDTINKITPDEVHLAQGSWEVEE